MPGSIVHRVLLALPLAVAGCVAPRTPPPPPAPVAPPSPPPVVVPPPPAPEDWRDMPLSPGTWRYTLGKDGSIATFGSDPAAPLFTMQCAIALREILLFAPGTLATSQVRLTTSYGSSSHQVGAILSGTGWRMTARDPALDRVAFSRGRFMVEGLGARLVLPSWAEVARVIEDCRG